MIDRSLKAAAPHLTRGWDVMKLPDGRWRIRSDATELDRNAGSRALAGAFGAAILAVFGFWIDASFGTAADSAPIALLAMFVPPACAGLSVALFVHARRETKGHEWVMSPGVFELESPASGRRSSRVTSGRFILDLSEAGTSDTLSLEWGGRKRTLVTGPWRQYSGEMRAIAAFLACATGWPVYGPTAKAGTTVPGLQPPVPLNAPLAILSTAGAKTPGVRIEQSPAMCALTVEAPVQAMRTKVIVIVIFVVALAVSVTGLMSEKGLLPGAFASLLSALLIPAGAAIVAGRLAWAVQEKKRVQTIVLDRHGDAIRLNGKHAGRLTDVEAVETVRVPGGEDMDPYWYVRLRSDGRSLTLPITSPYPAVPHDAAERLAAFLGVPMERVGGG